MELFRKVSVNEVPEKEGTYITDFGELYYQNGEWTYSNDAAEYPNYWLEEVKEPTEEEIESLSVKNIGLWGDHQAFCLGFNKAIKLLKGE